MAGNSILAQMAVQLTADVGDFNRGMAEARKNLSGFKKAGELLKGFGEDMTKYVTLPVAGFAGIALKSAGDIQALKKGLEAVAGSASEADKQFNGLKEVAKLPGLGLEEAVKGSINLQAIGFSAAKAQKSIAVMGNAIATVGGGRDELGRSLHGLEQLANTDFPLGEDLNIIKEAIPQVTPLLKEAFGTARSDELRALGITSEQVVDTIINGLGKLPPVTGGLKNSFENLGDSTKIALSGIGDIINKTLNVEGFLNKLADGLNGLSEGFSNLKPWVQETIIVLGAVAAAIGPVAFGLGSFGAFIPTLVGGFKNIGTALKIVGSGFLSAAKAAASFVAANFEIIAIVAASAALIVIAKSVGDAWSVVGVFFNQLWAQIKLSFANGLLAIIQTVNKFGSVFGIEFKGAEAALQSFADKANEELTEQPYVSLGDALGAVADKMVDNVSGAMTAVKGLFFQSTQDAKAAADTIDKVTNNKNKNKGGGSSRSSSIAPLQTRQSTEIDSAFTPITIPVQVKLMDTPENTAEFNNALKSKAQKAQEAMQAAAETFASQSTNLVNNALIDSFSLVGESIGTAISGGDGMQTFLNGMLVMIADFAGQMGKMLIAVALAAAGLQVTLSNPAMWPVALAAGVALVAAGAAIKGFMAKGVKGGAAPSAPRSSSPNVGSPGTSGGFGTGRVEFSISGSSLQGVLKRNDYLNQRFGR